MQHFVRLATVALGVLLVGHVVRAQPASERVLRIVPNADLQTLDPIVTTAGVVSSHAHMVYDQLFGRDAAQNRKLSDMQATLVQRYLVSKGVSSTRVLAKGYGDTLPLDRTTKRTNDRIEIVVVSGP